MTTATLKGNQEDLKELRSLRPLTYIIAFFIASSVALRRLAYAWKRKLAT